MRRIDDVMDNDMDPPVGFTVATYLKQKEEIIESFTENGVSHHLLIQEDILFIKLLSELKNFKSDFYLHIRELWKIMLWDYNRQKEQRIVPQHELTTYAALQDKVILEAMTKLFDGNVECIKKVLNIHGGIFSKIDWLHDMPNDLQKGIVNIPKEAVENYNIDLVMLKKSRTRKEFDIQHNFKRWYGNEVIELSKQWNMVRNELGYTFGGTFSPKRKFILSLIMLMIKGFEKDLLLSRSAI